MEPGHLRPEALARILRLRCPHCKADQIRDRAEAAGPLRCLCCRREILRAVVERALRRLPRERDLEP